MAKGKICAERHQNVFAQFHVVRIANGVRSRARFFRGSDATRKISSFSVSRSQRSEKSGGSTFRKRACALGQTNRFGTVSQGRLGIRRKEPRKFVQHSR